MHTSTHQILEHLAHKWYIRDWPKFINFPTIQGVFLKRDWFTASFNNFNTSPVIRDGFNRRQVTSSIAHSLTPTNMGKGQAYK